MIKRGAEGLSLTCDLGKLALICSNGLVPDLSIGDEPWTLGEYIKRNGGAQNRSKKVWGIYIPADVDIYSEEAPTTDSVSFCVLIVAVFSQAVFSYMQGFRSTLPNRKRSLTSETIPEKSKI